MSQTTILRQSEILENLVQDRILILDGAMGTMIQSLRLDEQAMRGERFAGHSKDLKNCVDILGLTHPKKLVEIHNKYLEAGADIICTNTFNASPVGLVEFELSESDVRDINIAAARCGREAIDRHLERHPREVRFLAGSIGPTARLASLVAQHDHHATSVRP